MKKIIFILSLTILLCPSLFAATLTPNTVPYVCKGGITPQLCNSNIVTDSKGNANIGFGSWVTSGLAVNTAYQAATDGVVYATGFVIGNMKSGFTIFTGPNNPPTNNPYFNVYAVSNSSTTEFTSNQSLHVRKGDYWEIVPFGSSGNSNPVVYSIAWLPTEKS